MPRSNSIPATHDARLERALIALDGLSVGDAFGQNFFIPGMLESCLAKKQPPEGRWLFTDDTVMAISICEVLAEHGSIDQDLLARKFADRFAAEPSRGYGSGAIRLLNEISRGTPWRDAARSSFGGRGSFGNGSAMRVAPLGAFFADDLSKVAEQATASAEITHAHPDGISGAIAVAVATAWCYRNIGRKNVNGIAMLKDVLKSLPESATRNGIEQAIEIPLDEWEFTAANVLGNGSQVTAPDTVPFCLWCAAAHLNSFTDALWSAMRVGGDMDTNCAIVGGIVAAAVGREGIPADWLRARERFVLKHGPKSPI